MNWNDSGVSILLVSERREACQRRMSPRRRRWLSPATSENSSTDSGRVKDGQRPNELFEWSFASRPALSFPSTIWRTMPSSQKNICRGWSTTPMFVSISKTIANRRKLFLRSKRKRNRSRSNKLKGFVSLLSTTRSISRRVNDRTVHTGVSGILCRHGIRLWFVSFRNPHIQPQY